MNPTAITTTGLLADLDTITAAAVGADRHMVKVMIASRPDGDGVNIIIDGLCTDTYGAGEIGEDGGGPVTRLNAGAGSDRPWTLLSWTVSPDDDWTDRIGDIASWLATESPVPA